MSRLPNLTAKQVAKALNRAGFVQLHQVGSHLVLYHEATGRGVRRTAEKRVLVKTIGE
jgi:predicted RNA binding protein YcfA (HicA-like mRNA interferase family)